MNCTPARLQEIDQHDVIMRINGAVTRSYENDCGHDPHQIVLGWDTGLQDAMRERLLCCGAMAVVTNNGGRAGHRSWGGNNPSVVISNDFMQAAHGSLGWAGRWPSTGFLALAVGLAVAQHIGARYSVYGFGACSPCNKYFDCERAPSDPHS